LIAYFLGNISARYYENLTMLSLVIAKNIGDGLFFETRCMCLPCALLTVDCRNHEPQEMLCDMWAAGGECVRNYPYMYAYCRRSCLKCDANTGILHI